MNKHDFVVDNVVVNSDVDGSVLKLVILEINEDDEDDVDDFDDKEIEDIVVNCGLVSWLQKHVTEQSLSWALLQTEKNLT